MQNVQSTTSRSHTHLCMLLDWSHNEPKATGAAVFCSIIGSAVIDKVDMPALGTLVVNASTQLKEQTTASDRARERMSRRFRNRVSREVAMTGVSDERQ
mmetsp:Transcript_10236/g.16680  ORF Transcript_10236/g.16680 Transcript_10236/m.16680 type:complete len:99 (-) Transcript_10236:8-304(-)